MPPCHHHQQRFRHRGFHRHHHSHGCQGSHFPRRFCPYFVPPRDHFDGFGYDKETDEGDEMPFMDHNKARVNESDTEVTVQMDVPGVKPPHVTIEEKAGEIEITAIRLDAEEEVVQTFQDILYIKPTTVDLSKASATLINGVLKMKAPKVLPIALDIETETGVPPPAPKCSDDDQAELRVSVDFPGVSPSEIKIQMDQESLIIEGERKIAEQRTITVRRAFPVGQPANFDFSKARSFSVDGVFTFVAPRNPSSMDEEEHPAKMRIIPVEDAQDVPSVDSLHLTEDEDDDDDAKK